MRIAMINHYAVGLEDKIVLEASVEWVLHCCRMQI